MWLWPGDYGSGVSNYLNYLDLFSFTFSLFLNISYNLTVKLTKLPPFSSRRTGFVIFGNHTPQGSRILLQWHFPRPHIQRWHSFCSKSLYCVSSGPHLICKLYFNVINFELHAQSLQQIFPIECIKKWTKERNGTLGPFLYRIWRSCWKVWRAQLTGILVVLVMTEFSKTLISEPRPHFLDTCKPNVTEMCKTGNE
jgi:hypothetical protein